MLGLLRAGQAGYCHEPPRNGPLEVLFEPVSTAAAERELEAGLLLATLMHELQMTPAGPGAAHRTDVRQRFAYLKPIGASCHVNSREGVPNVVRYLNSKREAESGRGLATWRKFNPPFDLAHQHEITAYLALVASCKASRIRQASCTCSMAVTRGAGANSLAAPGGRNGRALSQYDKGRMRDRSARLPPTSAR